MIRTVKGDIEPSELGVTCSHEHLVGQPPDWKLGEDPDLLLDDVDKAREEVERFKAAGGRSLFEATAWDYKRDVKALAYISELTSVNIIACAGFNKGLWFEPRLNDWSATKLTDHIIAEVAEGIDGMPVCGGCIKFGTGYNRISETEERVIRAAARAHRVTGAPLHGHTENGTMALEQLAILKEEGVDLTRVGICHLARNPDHWYLRQIARSGAYMCFDGISKVKYYTEEVRVALIRWLWEAGYGTRLLIGGDLARRSDSYSYSRGPGLAFILQKWVPRFRSELSEEGVADEVVGEMINALLVTNPATYFSFCAPY